MLIVATILKITRWWYVGMFTRSHFLAVLQVKVWEGDHVTWRCTKQKWQFNEIWLYLKLIENINWHIVHMTNKLTKNN